MNGTALRMLVVGLSTPIKGLGGFAGVGTVTTGGMLALSVPICLGLIIVGGCMVYNARKTGGKSRS